MSKKSPIFIGLVIFLASCAGKLIPMKNESIRSIQKMRVGLVELTSHQLDPSKIYDCLKEYPSASITLDGQTKQELESVGWLSDQLIQSLQAQDFQTYHNIKNYSLLLMLFKNKEQKNFIRLINFLSQQVITLSLNPEQFSCENVFNSARLIVVDSIPPYADVLINGRAIGEAPIWTSLRDGTYEVQCQLPDDVFPKSTLQIPGKSKILCKRENQAIQSIEHNNDETADVSEKTNSWFLYGLVGALSVGGAILPFLVF